LCSDGDVWAVIGLMCLWSGVIWSFIILLLFKMGVVVLIIVLLYVSISDNIWFKYLKEKIQRDCCESDCLAYSDLKIVKKINKFLLEKNHS